MTEANQSQAITNQNDRAFNTLARAIERSQGQFSLILARCNYLSLRDRLIEQLQTRLQATLFQPLPIVALPESATTLYTTLLTHSTPPPSRSADGSAEVTERAHGGSPLPPPPSPPSLPGIFVLGLESVANLHQLLVSTNQVRDSFRQQFDWPLVLWVNDRVLQGLIKWAPDFKSWAATPIRFELAIADLITSLHDHTNRVFANILETGDERFLPNWAISQPLNALRRSEVEFAIQQITQMGQRLDPVLEASVYFLLGQKAHAQAELETAQECYEASLKFWQERTGANRAVYPSPFTERAACVLIYLGLVWRSRAVLQQAAYHPYCEIARSYFQQGLHLFEQINRQDLVARFLIAEAETLQKLEQWPELEIMARKGLVLHKLHKDLVRLARDHGFLAEVALSRQDWTEAKQQVEMALGILEQADYLLTEHDHDHPHLETGLEIAHRFHASWYLLLLARAEAQLGNPDGAIAHLENIRDHSYPKNDPRLYIKALDTLRSLYFNQKRYRSAFNTKCLQRSLEQQFSLRAFVGALRLAPQQHLLNLLPETTVADLLAQEIAASGRSLDVQKLIARLGRNDLPLTVIHGPSGVGKSSILTAGLIPALHQTPIGDRTPLPILCDRYTDWAALLTEKLQAEIENRNQESEVIQNPEQPSATNYPPFAEIQNPKSKIQNSSPSSPSPLPLLRQLTQQPTPPLLPVLIFDQFEEFFFAHPTFRDRRPFYELLRDSLHLGSVKIILSLREDYLHHLLEFQKFTQTPAVSDSRTAPPSPSSLPSPPSHPHTLPPTSIPLDSLTDILGKDIRYPLGDFSPADARTVITRLTERVNYYLDDDLLDALVEDLAGELGEIRPIELQVVGAQLQAEGIQTLATYRNRGPKEKLVQRFLEDVVKDCGPENEDLARIILFLLTNEKGTRPLKTREDLETDLLDLNLTPDQPQLDLVLDVLVNSGLLFLIPESPAERYQIVHDYLVSFIREHYKTGLVEELERERQQRKQAEEKLSLELQQRLAAEEKLSFELKQRLQVEQERNLAVQQRLRWFRIALAVFAGSTLLVGGFWWQTESRKANADILAQTLIAENFLISNQDLDALLAAVKLGKNLQKASNRIEVGNRIRGITTIQQINYSIREKNRLEPHKIVVVSVAFSPDGKTIASVGGDNSVKLWNHDGHLLKTLKSHRAMVNSAAFSPDGKTLASASLDNTVKLWSRDGQLLKTLKSHQAEAWSVAFSPDSQTLASASWDKTVKLWSRDGQLLKTLKSHQAIVNSVAFSPDGRTLVSASGDKTVKLWNHGGQLLKTLQGHQGAVWSTVFSPDGRTLASASGDKTVKLWNRDGRLLKTLQGHQGAVWSVAFSPDSQTLASASVDQTVNLWSHDGQLLQTLQGYQFPVWSVAFSPDSKTLASASQDTVKLWSRYGQRPNVLQGHRDEVTNVTFSPDSQTVVSASMDKTVKLWSRNGQLLKTLKGHWNEVTNLIFSPNGQTLTSISRERINLWNRDGQLLKTLQGNGSGNRMIALSRDGQTLASASNDNTVKLWNRDGHLLKTLKSHQAEVWSVAFSPDSQTLASASMDKTVKLWSLNGKLLKTFPAHQDVVTSVVFSPSGQTLASASWDKTVKLWSLNGKLLKTLQGHQDWVTNVAFSPDGQTLASASNDHTVKLWSHDGTLLKTLKGHKNSVLSVAFSPDGKTLASASEDKTVILWNLDLEDLLAQGCNWLGDYLRTNPNVTDEDRRLCDGVGKVKN